MLLTALLMSVRRWRRKKRDLEEDLEDDLCT